MRINKYLDLLDRVGWTAIQAFVGYLLANVALGDSIGWKKVLIAAAIAAGIAAGKVVVAQNTGNSGMGDAIPGASVIEKP